MVDNPQESLLEGLKGRLAGPVENIVHVEADKLLLVGAGHRYILPVRLERFLDDVTEVGLRDGEGETEHVLLVSFRVVQQILCIT